MLDGVEVTIGPHGLRIDLGAIVKVIGGGGGTFPLPPAGRSPMRDTLLQPRGHPLFFRTRYPDNWPELRQELGWLYHWPPSELKRLTVPEIVEWHEAAQRFAKR